MFAKSYIHIHELKELKVTNGQKAAEKGYSSDFLPFVSRDRSGESWFSSDSASDNLSDMRELICDPVLDQKKKTQMGSCESTHWTLHTYSTSTSENHFSLLQHEIEKLRSDIEKMRSELRYEIDKVSAGHRLDLNLERGRIRDELANQNQETANLTNKLDREIHTLRAQLEAAKYDVIKYCIGTLVSISAVGLAVVRLLK
ncbi:putative Allene oxide cyclase [Capsicum annuum]|nr:putative Allene oxide cyclase [Capsicum annuum]